MISRRLELAPLTRRTEVARDTFILHYALDLETDIAPGQFAMVHPGRAEEYLLPRPLSILDASDGELQLLVKIAGRGSRALVEAPLGTAFRIFAPLGRGFDLETLSSHPLVLVAGGVGIVPLHLAARRLAASGRPPVKSLFGARRPTDLPMPMFSAGVAGEWELWVEEEATGTLRQGLVTRGLEEVLSTVADAVILTCGPTPMMQAVARLGMAAQCPVWLCLEEQMGCGAGVCRSCVVESKDAPAATKLTVCREGPVMALDSIRYLPEELDDATAARDGGRACAP